MRVAEVWMDEYKALFYNARGLHGVPFGDVESRRAMRRRLQCKSFKWYLDTVHPDQYVPDLNPRHHGMVSSPDKKMCLDPLQHKFGSVGIYGCHGHGDQRWSLSTAGKANSSCCPCARTTPFPEEKSILGVVLSSATENRVIYGVLLWADMNAATPLGALGRSVMSHGRRLGERHALPACAPNAKPRRR